MKNAGAVDVAKDTDLDLDYDTVARLASLPLHCHSVEYPNKLNQVLQNQSELLSPSGQLLDDSFRYQNSFFFQNSILYFTVVLTGTVLSTAIGSLLEQLLFSQILIWHKMSVLFLMSSSQQRRWNRSLSIFRGNLQVHLRELMVGHGLLNFRKSWRSLLLRQEVVGMSS